MRVIGHVLESQGTQVAIQAVHAGEAALDGHLVAGRVAAKLHRPVSHVDVQQPVAVVVGQRQSADEVADRVEARTLGHIGKCPVTIVPMDPRWTADLSAVEVVHDDQIQVAVDIEIGEGCGSSAALVHETGGLGDVTEGLLAARIGLVPKEAVRVAGLAQHEDAQVAVPEDIGDRRAVTHIAQHHHGHGVRGGGRRTVGPPKHEPALYRDVPAQLGFGLDGIGQDQPAADEDDGRDGDRDQGDERHPAPTGSAAGGDGGIHSLPGMIGLTSRGTVDNQPRGGVHDSESRDGRQGPALTLGARGR